METRLKQLLKHLRLRWRAATLVRPGVPRARRRFTSSSTSCSFFERKIPESMPPDAAARRPSSPPSRRTRAGIAAAGAAAADSPAPADPASSSNYGAGSSSADAGARDPRIPPRRPPTARASNAVGGRRWRTEADGCPGPGLLLEHATLTAKKSRPLPHAFPSKGPDDARGRLGKSQDLSALVREDEDGVGDLFAAWPYSW